MKMFIKSKGLFILLICFLFIFQCVNTKIINDVALEVFELKDENEILKMYVGELKEQEELDDLTLETLVYNQALIGKLLNETVSYEELIEILNYIFNNTI